MLPSTVYWSYVILLHTDVINVSIKFDFKKIDFFFFIFF